MCRKHESLLLPKSILLLKERFTNRAQLAGFAFITHPTSTKVLARFAIKMRSPDFETRGYGQPLHVRFGMKTDTHNLD